MRPTKPRHYGALLSAIVLVGVSPCQGHTQAHSGFDIVGYVARIEPDFGSAMIKGTVTITAVFRGSDPRLQLNAGELQIDSVRENGAPVAFRKAGSLALIVLKGGESNQTREIEVSYHGAPTKGVTFFADGPQVSTAFATSQWLPSVDEPAERATLDLTLILPQDLEVVASGDLVSERNLPDGRIASTWSQRDPVPAYTFGFAAGRFREVIDRAGEPALRYLASPSFSEVEIRQIFRDTADMLAFFEDKAGVAFPARQYTQVLLTAAGGQEMAGFAVMGDRYGTRVLADGAAIWLGAHEAAHQWWGNGVTNGSWNHFWLNEGIASFMTAAYLEHRFGRDVYMRYIEAARKKYEEIRQRGNDKSLVFKDWQNPTTDDRSLVYDKGAYVTHLLRERLGEDAFWSGIRAYTQESWGKSVTTQGFRAAMERSSGEDLSEFFNRWIYAEN